MTPTLLRATYYAKRAITPSRLAVFTIAMLLIAASGLVLTFQSAPQTLYNGKVVPVIQPSEQEVCIGGTVHFSTITETTEDQLPGRLEIDEAWCLAGPSGACKTVTPPNPRFPILEPKRIVTPRVSRDVPTILTPGVYHFWHTATDSHGRVTGYIVAPISIRDCSKDNLE